MRSPLDDGPLIVLDSVDSTQRYAAELLRHGEPVGAVLAYEQTAGRGRFDRAWSSPAGECLAVSLVLPEFVGHPKPYLVGMAIAVAAAEGFDCSLRWPNDLVLGAKKLGGILTELVPNDNGVLVPVVGIGVNLAQDRFSDELSEIATSLYQAGRRLWEPEAALEELLASVRRVPVPQTWADVEPLWSARDATPGKRYRLHSGEDVIAVGIGAEGQLLVKTNGGRPLEILAAQALFGA